MPQYKVGDYVRLINRNNFSGQGLSNHQIKVGDVVKVIKLNEDGVGFYIDMPYGGSWGTDTEWWFKPANFELATPAPTLVPHYIPLVGQTVKPGDRVRVVKGSDSFALTDLIQQTGSRVFTVKTAAASQDTIASAMATRNTTIWLVEADHNRNGWYAERFDLEVMTTAGGGSAVTVTTSVKGEASELQKLLDLMKTVPDPKLFPLEASKALGAMIDDLSDKLAGITLQAPQPVSMGTGQLRVPVPVTLDNIRKGLRVVRGPDWKWRDQDGGAGSVGYIKSINVRDGQCGVAWDKTDDYHVYHYIERSDLASYEL